MTIAPLAGQNVLVVGLAREGAAAARWLAGQGARVTASDLRPAAALADAVTELAALGIDLRLGPQTPDLLAGVDAVVASPGVPQDHPLFQAARLHGIPVTTETRLFAQRCPAPIVGITGSSGKTTTTTLTFDMLEASGLHTWLGGNIGAPLLGRQDEMTPDDRVVLELSSFQLLYWQGSAASPAPVDVVPWHDPRGLSPHIAAILNITPNHLDRHPSMSHYTAAKANILAYQGPSDVAVLNHDDAVTGVWASGGQVTIEASPDQAAVGFALTGQLLTFGLAAAPTGDGAWCDNDWVWWRWQDRTEPILPRKEFQLRGEHNLANLLAACCLAGAAGANPEAMRQAAASFRGVEHRLEVVRKLHGVLWINDSIATSPERALAALRSFEEPLILLAGGRDKHLPWDAWAAAVHQSTRCVITFGEAAGLIAEALTPSPAGTRLESVLAAADLAEAISTARQVACPGDVVLLSPGGTSYDAYIDFAARGQHFRDLVNAFPDD